MKLQNNQRQKALQYLADLYQDQQKALANSSDDNYNSNEQINNSQQNSHKQFHPFQQERDSLGFLIATNSIRKSSLPTLSNKQYYSSNHYYRQPKLLQAKTIESSLNNSKEISNRSQKIISDGQDINITITEKKQPNRNHSFKTELSTILKYNDQDYEPLVNQAQIQQQSAKINWQSNKWDYKQQEMEKNLKVIENIQKNKENLINKLPKLKLLKKHQPGNNAYSSIDINQLQKNKYNNMQFSKKARDLTQQQGEGADFYLPIYYRPERKITNEGYEQYYSGMLKDIKNKVKCEILQQNKQKNNNKRVLGLTPIQEDFAQNFKHQFKSKLQQAKNIIYKVRNMIRGEELQQ